MKSKAFTYNVTIAPAVTPVTLATVKYHLKLDAAEDVTLDAYLTLLIDAATACGEKYTKRDFINRTYTTYRDTFCNCLELRRSQVSSITSIKYLVDDVLTTLSTDVYGFTDVTDYPNIYLKENQSYPTGVDNVPQAIEIIFVSGYGAAATNVPADVQMALLVHIAFMYENRGDCDLLSSSLDKLPPTVTNLYDKIKLINIGGYDNCCSYNR